MRFYVLFFQCLWIFCYFRDKKNIISGLVLCALKYFLLLFLLSILKWLLDVALLLGLFAKIYKPAI